MKAVPRTACWAVLALVLAVLPVIPGFVRAAATPGGQVAAPGLWDTLYTYAWFVTFSLGFAVHLLLSTVGRSRQKGGL